jgi:hypothetical protein
MPIPDKSRYLPGRKLVRLPDGRTITRSAAENMEAQKRGFRSNYQRRQIFRGMKEQKSYGRDLQRAKERGVSKETFDRLRSQYELDRQHGTSNIDKSPDGPLSQYLKAIGRRSDSAADWPVGDSPGIK